MKLVVEQEYNGERLDKFLTEKITDTTRSQLQKLIKGSAVLVNGTIASVHYFLKEGDKIEIGEVKNKEVIASLPQEPVVFVEPVIVHETVDYLIVNKPSGIMVHPAEGSSEKTMVEWLLEKYPEIIKVGEDPIRPGIVHRIDKEVSGLLVVAKTQDFFECVKEQFQTRKVKKMYKALVYGTIEKDYDVINFPIERASGGHKMVAVPATVKGDANEKGKRAITEYVIAKRYINYTLLDVDIKTGRTHQIRVHMLAFGHPIVGDDLYSTKVTREKNKKNNLGRIFLVSRYLSFIDLAGKKQEFEIDIPKELTSFLETKVK